MVKKKEIDNVIIDVIKKLIDSDESAYSIAKHTGVNASAIQNIRLGNRKVENLTLATGEKLYLYAISKEK